MYIYIPLYEKLQQTYNLVILLFCHELNTENKDDFQVDSQFACVLVHAVESRRIHESNATKLFSTYQKDLSQFSRSETVLYFKHA